jgi:hypothetical protein
MMVGHLLNSPLDILIVPIGMILLFAVILLRMYVPRKPVIGNDADQAGAPVVRIEGHSDRASRVPDRGEHRRH